MTEPGEETLPPSRGSKAARCGAARLAAVQTVFQMLGGGGGAREAARDFLDHYAGMPVEGQALLTPDRALYAKIVQGVENRREDLDAIILHNLKDNKKEADSKPKSVDMLLQAILLCGCYEILVHTELDAPLLISAYLHVTRAFYEGREPALVNAVLDAVARTVRCAAKAID